MSQSWVLSEIKTWVHGMAVCMIWSPGLGLELCMREFWIDQVTIEIKNTQGLMMIQFVFFQGWEYPWVYPDCN